MKAYGESGSIAPHILTSAQEVSKSRDSSVGIALGYGLDDWGSIPGGCWEFFS
jgi:hypothetical protein